MKRNPDPFRNHDRHQLVADALLIREELKRRLAINAEQRDILEHTLRSLNATFAGQIIGYVLKKEHTQ